jgi:hypothetical protein
MSCPCNGCAKLWKAEEDLRRSKPVTVTLSRDDARRLAAIWPANSPSKNDHPAWRLADALREQLKS